MSKSFVWYESFTNSIKELKAQDEHLAFLLFEAISDYGLNGSYDESNAIINAVMSNIKIDIDNAQKRYNASVENGKKGGRPKKGTDDEFAELYYAGYTKAEICAKLGFGDRTYSRRLKILKAREAEESKDKIGF